MYEQWTDLYGMLTRSEEYRQKVKSEHEKHGAFRSGEGTALEVLERRKQQEERLYLQNLFDKKESTLDTDTNKKLYELFLADFKLRVLRNDEVDLVPHHLLSNNKAISLLSLQ